MSEKLMVMTPNKRDELRGYFSLMLALESYDKVCAAMTEVDLEELRTKVYDEWAKCDPSWGASLIAKDVIACLLARMEGKNNA